VLLDKPLYDARLADGVTDLMRMACSHGDLSVAMKELLDTYPYLINMQDSHGNTALMRAECFGAHGENIKVLQQAPYADLSLKNDAGFTAADIRA
jgi:ankyrin repeat protein